MPLRGLIPYPFSAICCYLLFLFFSCGSSSLCLLLLYNNFSNTDHSWCVVYGKLFFNGWWGNWILSLKNSSSTEVLVVVHGFCKFSPSNEAHVSIETPELVDVLVNWPGFLVIKRKNEAHLLMIVRVKSLRRDLMSPFPICLIIAWPLCGKGKGSNFCWIWTLYCEAFVSDTLRTLTNYWHTNYLSIT